MPRRDADTTLYSNRNRRSLGLRLDADPRLHATPAVRALQARRVRILERSERARCALHDRGGSAQGVQNPVPELHLERFSARTLAGALERVAPKLWRGAQLL